MRSRYSTSAGVCSAGGQHLFEDDLTGFKGYLSPLPPTWEGEVLLKERVCLKHYTKQREICWPEEKKSKTGILSWFTNR